MSRNTRAVWSAVLGLLSALTLPVAVFATRYSSGYELLQAGFAIPLAIGLGVAAVILARRARTFDDVRLGKAGGRRRGRIGWLLGVLGICLAASAAIALLVYQLLVAVE